MPQPRPHAALRYGLRHGLPYAAIIGALAGADVAIQAWRRAIGPSAQALHLFSYLFLILVVVLLLVAGFLPAQSTGRVRPGTWAGGVAVGLPCVPFAVVAILQTVERQGRPNGAQITGYVIAFLLLVAIGAAAGALISLPGALAGRARYRADHAAELAALAAERAAHEAAHAITAPRRRSMKKRVAEWAIGLLLAAAILLLIVAPPTAALWAYETLLRWQSLALAAGALIAGVALLIPGQRRRWLDYLFDWLGLMCLCVAVLLALALAGVGSGATSLISVVAPLVYIWRIFARLTGPAQRLLVEPPERVPVVFRDDGQVLRFYPSRRKLAAHGAIAAAMVLVFTALTVLFRGAGALLVAALGVFALLGLYGLIPDLARLVHRWPVLIVTSEGITDLASAGIFGFGLIPWHELVTVFDAGTMRGGRFRELAILPVSFRRLLAHQPRLKRPLLRFAAMMGGGAIYLSSIYLSQPPAVIAQQINDYVKAHAPADFLEPEDEDEDEHQSEHAAQTREMTRDA